MCYRKGTMVQLADGSLRRVEEMTTNDFLSSVEATPDLAVDESRVIRIQEKGANPGHAFITLEVGRKKKHFTVETPLEHPFFVYNRGWCSCSPDRTSNRYGLTVRKLKVGDSCMSLTKATAVSSSLIGGGGGSVASRIVNINNNLVK